MRPARNCLAIGAARGGSLLIALIARAADSPLRFIKTFGGSGADAIRALTIR
jgi:hypothetical protein